jgi:hypothetical protein
MYFSVIHQEEIGKVTVQFWFVLSCEGGYVYEIKKYS